MALPLVQSGGGGGSSQSTTPTNKAPAVTSFNSYGDSITLGYGLGAVGITGPSYLSWPALVAKGLNVSLTNNYAVTGAVITTSGTFYPAAQGKSPTAAVANMVLGLSNHLVTDADGSTKQAQLVSGLEAMVVYLALPTSLRQETINSAITYSGTDWTLSSAFGVSNNVRFSSVSGATATATVNGTTAYIGTYGFPGYANNAAVTIDGASKGTISFDTSYSGGVVAPQCFRFSGLSSGNHTVVLTVPAGGKFCNVQWMAGNGGTTQTPLVVVGATIPRSGLTAQAVSLNTDVNAMVTNLVADGLNVMYVDTNTPLSLTATPPQYFSDGVHPNEGGQQFVASAVLAALKPNPTFPAESGVGGDTLTQNLNASQVPTSFLTAHVPSVLAWMAARDLESGWASLDTNGFLKSTALNKLTFYNQIATIDNGIPTEYAHVDLTAQSAPISATTLYAVPATGQGMYRISWVASLTTAGTSSTLGGANGFQVLFTDPADSVVKTTPASATSAANTTATTIGGSITVYAKLSTNIQYQMGYTSSGTAMQYDVHVKCEAL